MQIAGEQAMVTDVDFRAFNGGEVRLSAQVRMGADDNFIVRILGIQFHLIQRGKVFDDNPIVAAVENDGAVIDLYKIANHNLVIATVTYDFQAFEHGNAHGNLTASSTELIPEGQAVVDFGAEAKECMMGLYKVEEFGFVHGGAPYFVGKNKVKYPSCVK